MDYIVSTFYKFINIQDCFDLRVKLKKMCSENDIKGTILIAKEGINFTVVGDKLAIDKFHKFLNSFDIFSDLKFNNTYCSFKPFQKLKVKVKSEIVTFKDENLDMSQTGSYLNPQQWEEFVSNEDVLLIDTRNDYEVEMGTFDKAVNPNTKNFSDLPKWVENNLDSNDLNKPIAMFCTGGIRCEKSTAYLKKLGYKNVYHLKNGILGYLQDIKNNSKIWKGKCFVFDDRASLDEELKTTVIAK